MTRWISCVVLSMSLVMVAQADVRGWHWYNEPVVLKKQRHENRLLAQFQTLPSTTQLKRLQKATRELRDKAILSGKVDDIAAYKAAQDFWLKKATLFTVGWEKMLLAYPRFNYSLRFSHENALASISQRAEHQRERQAIAQLSKKHGLLFFYRSNWPQDRLFLRMIHRFSKNHHLALLAIAVNDRGASNSSTKTLRQNLNKAHALGIWFFPALMLVNVQTHAHRIVSYGFKSDNELSERLLNIADGWQPKF